MPKEDSHQWPLLAAMRSSGRSLSAGKALPRRNCPANAPRCSTAAVPPVLTPPTTPLSPGQGDRVASPFGLSALLGALSCDPSGGARPGVSCGRNPENVKVEKTHIGRSSVGSRGERGKKGGKSGGTEWKDRATSARTHSMWTKKPL